MKPALTTLLFALCISAGTPNAVGQDVESPHVAKHKHLEDMLVGNWSISGTSDGAAVTGEFKGEWAGGKESVIYKGYFQQKGDNAKVYISGISGWDSKTGMIKELLFSSDGSCSTAFFEIKGNEVEGNREGIDRDGNEYKQKLKFSIGKNSWVGHPSNTIGTNGKVLAEHGEWVFKRT